MSIPVMRAVVDSERYGGLRKLVLLALAAYSDPDGTSIFPSVDTVAKKNRLVRAPGATAHAGARTRGRVSPGGKIEAPPAERIPDRPAGFRGVASNTPRRFRGVSSDTP